jgi:hypothetical protein
MEPDILAMEEDLVLLRVIVSSKWEFLDDADYYIYQATDEAAGGGPSLKRLPRPPRPYGFGSHQVGILRCGARHQWRDNALCRPHRGTAGDFYIVAALCKERSSMVPEDFVIFLYNSSSPTIWSTHKISVDSNQHGRQYGCYFQHRNSKVISVGGDSGTMGFVDLWRGIILCDVLKLQQGKTTPPIRYVTLPPPLLPGRADWDDDARLARDIAVVQQGRTIRYVELQVNWKPHPTFRGCYFRDGWVSRIWTRPVDADCAEDCWKPGCKQESSDIPIDNNPHFKLLPVMMDHSGMTMEPFKGLFICQPTLSLSDDDDLVYFMTKAKSMDGKAWVIAVDMKNNTLQGVDGFAAERTIDFGYMHSRISKYLTAGTGNHVRAMQPSSHGYFYKSFGSVIALSQYNCLLN